MPQGSPRGSAGPPAKAPPLGFDPTLLPEGAGALIAGIVNALPNPVFVKDEQHRFVFFNDAFCAVMGRSRSELLGHSDFDFVPAEEAHVFWEADTKVFATGRPHEN